MALIGLAFAVAIGSGWIYVNGNPFESQFHRACEEGLKDILRSPSTYRRLALTESEEPISIDEYLRDESPLVAKQMKSAFDHAVRTSARLEYDADNAYGVPIRGSSDCTYDSLSGDASRASKSTVKIDGKTATDRLVDQLRQERQNTD